MGQLSDSIKSTEYLQHNTARLHLGWHSVCHRMSVQRLMFPESWISCGQTHGPDQKYCQKHKLWISTKKLKVKLLWSWEELWRIRKGVYLFMKQRGHIERSLYNAKGEKGINEIHINDSHSWKWALSRQIFQTEEDFLKMKGKTSWRSQKQVQLP